MKAMVLGPGLPLLLCGHFLVTAPAVAQVSPEARSAERSEAARSTQVPAKQRKKAEEQETREEEKNPEDDCD